MFSQPRARISEFFNRLPTAVLIPAVLLIAFGIAAFLIWAGIEMSPVTDKMAESLFNEKKSVLDGQSGSSSSGGPGKNILKSSGPEDRETMQENRRDIGTEEYSVHQGQTDKSASSSGNPGGGSSSITGGSQNGNPSNADSDFRSESSSSSAVSEINGSHLPAGQASQRLEPTEERFDQGSDQATDSDSPDSNVNSNQNGSGGEGAPERCYYPSGDVKKWWHKATPKQRECYISLHGEPDLGREVPYFCAYNNSEDCYYR